MQSPSHRIGGRRPFKEVFPHVGDTDKGFVITFKRVEATYRQK